MKAPGRLLTNTEVVPLDQQYGIALMDRSKYDGAFSDWSWRRIFCFGPVRSGLRFQIGPGDSDSVLYLFALVLDRVRQDQSPFHVQQGTLLQWIIEIEPTIDDLRAGLQGSPPQHRWPPQIVDATVWPKLQGGSFLNALKSAVEAAPRFGVKTGAEICRIHSLSAPQGLGL